MGDYFAYWNDRHVLMSVDSERIVRDLFADGYPRNLQLQVNLKDLIYLPPLERKLKTPPGYVLQSIDLPAYVLRHSIQVRESGIFGIGAKIVKKNIILGASTRRDLRQLASACGFEVQVTPQEITPQEIHDMAINLTKSNVLGIFRTVMLYERLLKVTASSVPPLDVTAEETGISYRWTRETHAQIDSSDRPAVFEYLEDLVDQAERHRVDGVVLSRLFKKVSDNSNSIVSTTDDLT